eukprot:Hpha_TRINITY_DN15097_c2_g17::TRINITY_DN15097_c2_g17_i1::g.123476::m.123476
MLRLGSLALLGLGAAAAPPPFLRAANMSLWTNECLRAFQTGGGFNSYAVDMDISSFDLEEMGGGLCTEWLACSFDNCAMSAVAWEVLRKFRPDEDDIKKITGTGLVFNLPAFTSSPKSVKEVVEVVKYAAATNTSISVKLSGHSYAGSSTQKNSIQINMRDFPKYSQTAMLRTLLKGRWGNSSWGGGGGQYVSGPLPSALWCDFLPDTKMTPACKLAKARGKPATLRLGGGERWDEAYRAVDDANYFFKKWYGQTVEIVGGGAGTVGATGGWMQGNGLSIGDERRWGFGADHVLELEMVLADGTHVKFGPTEWTAAPGFQFPKTTVVTGYCNANVDADESKWEWGTCSHSIPFADLWHAVRGGGGGSYGIVTALTYQLHPRRQFEALIFNTTVLTYVLNAAKAAHVPTDVLQNHLIDFTVDLLWSPEQLGLSESVSVNCGSPGISIGFKDMIAQAAFSDGALFLFCRDGAGEQAAAAYRSFVANYTGALPSALATILEPVQDSWANAFSVLKRGTSYGGFFIAFAAGVGDMPGPAGRVYDSPHPQVDSQARDCWSTFVPVDFLRQKNDDVHALLSQGNSHLTGGYAGTSHDQTTALPAVQRMSGLQTHIPPGMQDRFLPLFQAFWPKPGPGEALTGGAEYNHIGPGAASFGPLRSDTSKLCRVAYSHERREKDCYSYQEFVWGTAGLRRLEKIKKAVDPQNLFNCPKCVGFDPSR